MRRPLILLAAAAWLCLALAVPARAASPMVSLDAPADNSSTADTTPTLSGTTDTSTPDVVVKIYSGPAASGSALQSLPATPAGGTWTVDAATLTPGTYTARAEQDNGVDPVGMSSPHTFRVGSPSVTLSPVPTPSSNRTPTFSGSAGTATGDSDVTVKVYSGTSASGSPVQTRTATPAGAGSWSVSATSLADGTYTAQATQTDTAGNPPGMSSPTTFMIDATPGSPFVTLAAPANGAATNSTTPPFTGTAGNAPGDLSTVTVEIYPGTGIAGSPLLVNADGSNGGWVTTAGLAAGTYTARAKQSDAAGNTGFSAPHTFTVDTGAPDTSITSGPSGTVRSTSATFAFAATEAGSFECRLDGGAFTGCHSPVTYSDLAQGPHTFEVRATDAAGNVDPASATASWQVDTSTPPTPPVALLKPFPIVRFAGRLTRTGVAFSVFEIVAPPGSRIEVTCTGRRCPLRRQAKKATRVRFPRFGRLRAGVVIEVRVTKSGTIGKYTRIRIRKGKLPSRSDSCLMPGKTKPTRCPS
jgi:large repetitive protein